MNRIIKLSVFFFAVMTVSGHAFAQEEQKDKDKEKKE